MAARIAPATIVICAPLPPRGPAAGRPALPVTWVAGLEALERHAAGRPAEELALALDSQWLASRQALRAAILRARRAVPGLAAAVARSPLAGHQALLAEEGIQVVVVEDFADVGRGSRRPAPAGWPCRSVTWGLWEVRHSPPRRSPGWAWLPGLPAPRPGALHVVAVDAADAHRLPRLLDWADRAVGRRRAVARPLAALPEIVSGSSWSARLAASVLRAA